MFVVPKLWDGGNCFIIGGGPSITKGFGIPNEVVNQVYKGILPISVYSDYMSALKQKHVIGVNMAFRLGDWIDVVIFGDNSYRQKYANELILHPALKVSIAPKKDSVFKWMKRDRSIGISLTKKPGELCWNNTSGAAAINLAIQLGVKKIYLLGFDMKLSNQNQHWHKEYAVKKIDNIDKRLFSPQIAPFAGIAKEAARMGVVIYNCNPDSAITVFPKITIKEALKEDKAKIKVNSVKKVSILVTAYKAWETIEATLDSIYAQTYKNIEVIVGIDGCEKTRDKVLQIRAKYKRLKIYYSNINVGTYILSNSLLSICKGHYFVRFDSDDVMYPFMVEELVKVNREFVRCQFNWEKKVSGDIISTEMYSCGPLFAKVEVVKDLGGYKPWRCSADSDLISRLTALGIHIYRLPKKLFKRYWIKTSLTVAPDTGMGSDYRKNLHRQILTDKSRGIVYINLQKTKLCKL